MPVEVILPRVDMDMVSGKIIRWHAKDGERVTKGKPLFDIESDKATMEIESPADGILGDVRVNEGGSSPVGHAVAYIFAEGESRAVAANGVRATPLARRLARQSGLAIATIHGSGPHGRIVADDVRKTTTVAEPAAANTERPAPALETAAHFHLRITCTVDGLLALCERLNLQAPKDRTGVTLWTLSVNGFVVKALAHALQRVPAANVTWDGGRIIRHLSSDIAIDGGPSTSVIRNAESKTLAAVSLELKNFAAKERDHTLTPAEQRVGAASISTLGIHGIEEFTAIITPPRTLALAVGTIVEAFVLAGGQPALSKRTYCTLSCDPRAVDRETGAELLGVFRRYIEDPALMLA